MAILYLNTQNEKLTCLECNNELTYVKTASNMIKHLEKHSIDLRTENDNCSESGNSNEEGACRYRKSYTTDFKRRALLHLNRTNNPIETATAFGINKDYLTKWNKIKDEIFNPSVTPDSKYIYKSKPLLDQSKKVSESMPGRAKNTKKRVNPKTTAKNAQTEDNLDKLSEPVVNENSNQKEDSENKNEESLDTVNESPSKRRKLDLDEQTECPLIEPTQDENNANQTILTDIAPTEDKEVNETPQSQSVDSRKRGRPKRSQEKKDQSFKSIETAPKENITTTPRPVRQLRISLSGKSLNSDKSETPISKPNKKAQPKKNTNNQKKADTKNNKVIKKKNMVVEEENEVSESEEESNNSTSDDDFKIDTEETEEEEEDQDIDDNDGSEKEKTKKKKIELDSSQTKKTYKTRRSILNRDLLVDTSDPDTAKENINNNIINLDDSNAAVEEPRIIMDKVDLTEKINEWSYELDKETGFFKKPILPLLSDKAIEPFISKKAEPPKIIIYDCPFCQKIFTYTLVFKSHLYSCPENKNVPEYLFKCANMPDCTFTSKKKQEAIKHYQKYHLSRPKKALKDDLEDLIDDNLSSDSDDSFTSNTKMTANKQNLLEVSRYYYLNKNEFKFSYYYLNEKIGNLYKNLNFIDKFFACNSEFIEFKHSLLDLSEKVTNLNDSNTLKFKLRRDQTKTNNCLDFTLKPFEIFNNDSNEEPVKMINVINNVTCMDWCPLKNQPDEASQFIAFSTAPLKSKNESQSYLNSSVQTIFKSENIIYILKLNNLNKKEFNHEVFGYLNEDIGYINCLKWRPDYGASSNLKSNSFLGYLLAAGSNGYAYIYYVNDMTRHSSFIKENSSKINVYKPKKKIILALSFSFGQCTSADWSQMDGGVQIALGYSNGSVALFNVNSKSLSAQKEVNDGTDEDIMEVYPIMTFSAHASYIKTLKFSKINSNILASGALFSRDVKIWDLRNTTQPIIDYEIFITDLEFSLHSNDLFMSKESNLKGDNHLSALDLSFNIFNMDKDESRTHSSLFFTNTTMSSIHQSDYLNKILVCDNDGSVILARSNDTKYWIQKHKLMNYSYAKIAKFSILSDKQDPKVNESYDPNEIILNKKDITIQIDLERINNANKPNLGSNTGKSSTNQFNKLRVDSSTLTKIKWNTNVGFQNWYACASLSGFIFIHKLNELAISQMD